MKEERSIDRLFLFVDWCKNGRLIKSRLEFERICGLSNNYLYNSRNNTKSSIGVDILAKVHSKFPMLNLTWIITGVGAMISHVPDEGYVEAYNSQRKKIENLKKIIMDL